jgi:hypothetical protein
MKTRDLHHASIIVGRKGTGKSTELARIAKAYATGGRKVLAIDVNGSAAYSSYELIEVSQLKRFKSGIARLMGTPSKDLIVIARDFKNGLLLFEDCTKYISGTPSPEIKTFLVDHRMNKTDIIFTFHSLKRIPPFFWEMISYITLLKTQEIFENSANRSRIPNYENILEAYKKVQANKDPYAKITVETLT